MAGELLDMTSEPDPQPGKGSLSSGGRRYVGVHFACCDVYSRIYVNARETAYVGHCPRCVRRIELKIGPGGTEARFFRAG